MEKDNSYEMIPTVKVTNAEDIEYNQGKRLDMSKYKQFDRGLNGTTYSDQQVRDKIGKNNGWAVCRSWSDVENKKMCFDVLVNAKESKIHVVDYVDICKDYGWTSFKWSDDGQMILPEK